MTDQIIEKNLFLLYTKVLHFYIKMYLNWYQQN